MDYTDNFHPTEKNDFEPQNVNSHSFTETKKTIDEVKKMDRGYNTMVKNEYRENGKLKKVKTEFYTSNDIGTHIRDAQSGILYSEIVGSADEDLYFKFVMATGQCKSSNGSSTLFYTSPQQLMSHLNIQLDPKLIESWQAKRDARIRFINEKKQKQLHYSKTVVH
jgi:hypothetical protein